MIKEQEKEYQERKLSYEGPEANKFSNIDYILGDTNNENLHNKETNDDIDNIIQNKNSNNGSSKLDKIKFIFQKKII